MQFIVAAFNNMFNNVVVIVVAIIVVVIIVVKITDEILVEHRHKPPEISDAPREEVSGSSATYFAQFKTLLNSPDHSDITFRLLGSRDSLSSSSSSSSSSSVLVGVAPAGSSKPIESATSTSINRISHETGCAVVDRDILADVSLMAADRFVFSYRQQRT